MDGALNNTANCSGQAYLPVPVDPAAPTPTKADLKYLAPSGLQGTPVFNVVYGNPTGLFLVTNAGKEQPQKERPQRVYIE